MLWKLMLNINILLDQNKCIPTLTQYSVTNFISCNICTHFLFDINMVFYNIFSLKMHMKYTELVSMFFVFFLCPISVFSQGTPLGVRLQAESFKCYCRETEEVIKKLIPPKQNVDILPCDTMYM